MKSQIKRYGDTNENKRHWLLYVLFNEDTGFIRSDNGADNVDVLKELSLDCQNAKNDALKGLLEKGLCGV